MFRLRNNTAFLSLLPVLVTTSIVGSLAIAAQAGESERPHVEVEVEVVESAPTTEILHVTPEVESHIEVEEHKVCEDAHPCAPEVYEVCEEQHGCEADTHAPSAGEVVEAEVFLEEGHGLTGTFSCVEQPVPTTVFYSPEGALPVIHWVSDYFSHSGWDPLTRCRAVSGRFQNFYEAGVLNYLTTGIVNRLPVVCVSSEVGGPCTGVLLTLKPGESGSAVIQQLFDLSYGYQVGALYESGSRIYIDMEQYLEGLAERQS